MPNSSGFNLGNSATLKPNTRPASAQGKTRAIGKIAIGFHDQVMRINFAPALAAGLLNVIDVILIAAALTGCDRVKTMIVVPNFDDTGALIGDAAIQRPRPMPIALFFFQNEKSQGNTKQAQSQQNKEEFFSRHLNSY